MAEGRPHCTESGADGRYQFEELQPGSYHVTATARDRLPGSPAGTAPLVLAAGAAKTDVDILLHQGGALVSGVVSDASGGVIARARVRAVRLLEPLTALEVESDDEGRFELSVPPGMIGLFASAEGYAQSSAGYVAPTSQAELTLTPESYLAGTVVSAEDGEPVANVEVRALDAETQNVGVYSAGHSDQRGQFRIKGLAPGAYMLIAKGGPWQGQLDEPAEVSVADGIKSLTIRVSRARELTGRVLIEGDNKPCPEGSVLLGGPDPELHGTGTAKSSLDGVGPAQFAEIEADGRVHFHGVPAAFYYVTVDCAGHTMKAGPRSLFVQDKSLDALTWTVSAGIKLKVRIVDGRGAPLPHETFNLVRVSEAGVTEMTLNVGENGELLTPGLPPGDYEVQPFGGPERGEMVRVSLRERVTPADAVLRLRGTGTILVEAKTDDGKPVEKLQVRAERASAPITSATPGSALAGAAADVGASGARASATASTLPVYAEALGQGKYRIGALPEGQYSLTADDEVNLNPSVQAKSAVQVAAGAVASVELRLASGGVIRGHVSDEHGERMPNVWVAATRSSAEAANPAAAFSAIGPNKRVLTDTSGDFALEGLAPDARYTIRASEAYGSAVAVRDVAPGAQLALRLPASAAIAGSVVDARGAPVSVFSVQTLNTDSASTRVQQVHDAQGRFSLRGLSPGHVEVAVTSPSGSVGKEHLQLTPSQNLSNVRIALSAQAAPTKSIAINP